MKKIKSILFLVVFGIMSLGVTAQDAQGYIKLEITDVAADDEQMAAQLEMMKGTETEVHYMGKKSLTVMNMMGGMIKMQNLLDEEGGLNMYMDAMGQKMHIPATKMELEKAKAENPTPMDDLEFAYDEEDRKEIMGFDCYKMTAKQAGGDETFLTAYITEEITANAAIIQGMDLSDFKGFPLEYQVAMGPMKMTITTVDYKKEVDPSVFKVKADGYTKMTYDEFMSQMGGGMGF